MLSSRRIATLAILLGLGVFAALAPTGPSAASELPEDGGAVSLDAARTAFRRNHPGARLVAWDDGAVQVSGSDVASGASPEAARDAFLVRNWPVFGVAPSALVAAGQHSLMGGRFTLSVYSERVDGIPVHDRWLKIVVRNGRTPQVVLVNSTVIPVAGAARAPLITADGAIASAAADDARLVEFGTPELAYHATRTLAATLCWRFFAGNGQLADPVIVDYFVDAVTGQVVDRRPGVYNVDITGTAFGFQTVPPLPDHGGNPPQNKPARGARVRVVGNNTTYVDAEGNYLLPHSGSSPVDVDFDLVGLWANVNNQGGADLTATVNITPPGPANFALNNPATEFATAQLNAMTNVTLVHDFIKSLAPDLTDLDYVMPVNVNLTSTCNAYYDPNNGSTNYYRAGGGCVNTAYSSVIYHEYGHAVTDQVPGGPDDGDYHEGMSDTLATLFENSYCLGPDFSGPGTGCLRNVDTPNRTYPCSGSVHTCGLVIAGAFWDLRTALIDTEGSPAGLALARQLYMGQELTGNHQIDPSVTVDVLTLDDDNGDIYDGTPHYEEIAASFGLHELTAPPLVELQIEYPQGRPLLLPPNQTQPLLVDVLPVAGNPVDASARLISQVANGPVATSTVTTLSAGHYQAELPAAACRTSVRFGFSITSDNNVTVSDPPNAPDSLHFAVAAIGTAVAVQRNFQVSPGWTVTNGPGLTDGPWTRGVPVDSERGDPPADYDGSGACWLTDNAPGNSDVDGGATTLTSEVLDLTGLDDPWLSYARWYSNTFGDSPEADIFHVELSNNGGASWSTLEIVGPSQTSPNPEVDGGWYKRHFRIADFVAPSSQFQVRFTASDLGGGSVVEAAVDDLAIYNYTCPATATPIPTDTPTPTVTPTPSNTPTPTAVPIARGDCNADGDTNAGDLSALVLEIFDGDPSAAELAEGGSFAGHPVGCDANDDTVVNAGDLSCVVLQIFNGPGACRD